MHKQIVYDQEEQRHEDVIKYKKVCSSERASPIKILHQSEEDNSINKERKLSIAQVQGETEPNEKGNLCLDQKNQSIAEFQLKNIKHHRLVFQYSSTQRLHQKKPFDQSDGKKGIQSREHIFKINNRLKNIRSQQFLEKNQIPIQQLEEDQHIKRQILGKAVICKSLNQSKINQFQITAIQSIRITEEDDEFLPYTLQRDDKKNKFREKLQIMFNPELQESKIAKNQFRTKIKKKCLEKNTHLLATIIRKKNETIINKEELYDFVNKIIAKTKLK